MPRSQRADPGGRGRGKKRLTPEEEVWHKVAERTSRSVEEAKDTVGRGEFLRWSEVLRREANDKRPLYWYLAQVAYEVFRLRASWGGASDAEKKQREEGVKSFLIDFVPEAATPPEASGGPEVKEHQILLSKMYWRIFLRGQKVQKRTPPNKGK